MMNKYFFEIRLDKKEKGFSKLARQIKWFLVPMQMTKMRLSQFSIILFLIILLSSFSFCKKEYPTVFSPSHEWKVLLHYKLKSDYTKNPSLYGAAFELNNLLLNPPVFMKVHIYFADPLYGSALFITASSNRQKDLLAFVKTLNAGQIKNLIEKESIWFSEKIPGLSWLLGNEDKLVLKFYKKQKSFLRKSPSSKLSIISKEVSSYANYSMNYPSEHFQTETLLFTNNFSYDYARIITFSKREDYYRAIFKGLEENANKEGLKDEVIFQGSRLLVNQVLDVIK